MTSFPFDIVGFDLDGTLLDTSADLAAAVNHALTSAGRPSLAVEQVKSMIGGGGRHMLAQALIATGDFDDGELDRLLDRMLQFYAANICVHSRPFPGALAALEELAAKGVKLAIVTNKRERFALAILEELGLRDRFACIIGGDTLGEGNAKPSPAPIIEMVRRCGGGRAAFVGDSIYDIVAGGAAGVPTVVVGFGFLTQPVETLGADAMIHSYSELIPALERLG